MSRRAAGKRSRRKYPPYGAAVVVNDPTRGHIARLRAELYLINQRRMRGSLAPSLRELAKRHRIEDKQP